MYGYHERGNVWRARSGSRVTATSRSPGARSARPSRERSRYGREDLESQGPPRPEGMPITFEVKETDLMGRIGVLKVGGKSIETPCLDPGHPPGPPRHPAGEVHRDGLRRADDELLHHVQAEEGGGAREGPAQDARLRRRDDDRLGRLPGPPVRAGRHDAERHRGVPVRDRLGPRRDPRQADRLLALGGLRPGDDEGEPGGREGDDQEVRELEHDLGRADTGRALRRPRQGFDQGAAQGRVRGPRPRAAPSR